MLIFCDFFHYLYNLFMSFDISIIQHTSCSIFYEMPHGLKQHGSSTVSIRPGSIVTCALSALDRITIPERPTLLAKHSSKEQDAFIKALKIKQDLVIAKNAFVKTVSHAFHRITHDVGNELSMITKKDATFLLGKLNHFLSLKKEKQIEMFTELNDSNYEENIAYAVEEVSLLSRFIKESKEKNLLDHLHECTIAPLIELQNREMQKFMCSEDIERLTASMMKYYDHKFNNKHDEGAFRESVLNMILRCELGIQSTTEFMALDHNSTPVTYTQPSIKRLLNFLSLHGPCVASGYYGGSRTTKIEHPVLLDLPMIGSRKVFRWTTSEDFSIPSMFCHCITVIGCRMTSNNEGDVFFVDPADDSDPMNTSTEKVYALAFKEFVRLNNLLYYTENAGVASFNGVSVVSSLPLVTQDKSVSFSNASIQSDPSGMLASSDIALGKSSIQPLKMKTRIRYKDVSNSVSLKKLAFEKAIFELPSYSISMSHTKMIHCMVLVCMIVASGVFFVKRHVDREAK